MLENQDYDFATNKDLVMGMVRGAMVCLHAILEMKATSSDDEVMTELFELLPHKERSIDSTVLKSEEHIIVENIEQILVDPKFTNFRNNLIAKLDDSDKPEEANLFKERLGIANDLMIKNRGIFSQIVSLIKTSKDDFMRWLGDEIELEHCTTQIAFNDLVWLYLPNIYNPTPTVNYLASSQHLYSNKAFEDPNAIHASSLYDKLILEKYDNDLIKLIQIINSGILTGKDRNFMWKLNVDPNYLELSEFKQILDLCLNCEGKDLSEKLSLLLESSNDPIVIQFKDQRLDKVKLTKPKLTLC